MDFNAVYTAVKESPAPALLVLALMALVWVCKEYVRAIQEAAKQEREQHAAHLATAMQVAPLAAKLADCVTLFERVFLARNGGPQS